MKIGIVGPADRAVAWEEHLRPHQSVKEVVIAPSLKGVGDIDACLILDETDAQIQTLLSAIKAGFHSFLISRLPTDLKDIEKVYHTAEEANVLLQFSHWPTFAPASQFMVKRIAKPTFIQVVREISHTDFLEKRYELEYYWIDELAFCLKWINGNVHQLDIKKVNLDRSIDRAIHLFLRFDSGATASIYVSTCAAEKRQHRFAADHMFVADCDVHSQTVRIGKENENRHLFFEKQSFDSSQAAEIATTQFLKSIQLNKATPYGGYDLLKLATEIDKIKRRFS